MFMGKKICRNCSNVCDKRGKVEGCKKHRSEVQEMIKNINKLLEENIEFEGQR